MNKKVKRLCAALFSTCMAVPTAVMAEESTVDTPRSVTTTLGTIDYDLTGSITLYKYIDNNGISADADGVSYADSSADMAAAIREKLSDESILPEKGVRFKLLKVADIEQVSNDKDTNSKTSASDPNTTNFNVTGTYYTRLDEEFFNTMNAYLGDNHLVAADSTMSTDGRTSNTDTSERMDHYESDELNEKLMLVNRSTAVATGETSVKGEVALDRIVRQRSVNPDTTDVGYCKEFELTTDEGFTYLDKLPLGLYLIAEVDYEHSSLSKYDNYWEVVADQYEDAIGDGNSTATTAQNGKTGDAETGTDDGIRTGQDGTTYANSSHSAGVTDDYLAGGSTYADIVSPCSPFLISLPMTNTTTVKDADGTEHEAGTVWQYDVTAYPKNGTLTIHKDIIVNNHHADADGHPAVDGNDIVGTEYLCDFKQTNYLRKDDGTEETMLDGDVTNGLTHQIDANIGDIITQLISVDVPRLVDDIDDETDIDATAENGLKKGENTNSGVANRDNTHRKHNATFIITDRMTKGLNLIDHDESHFIVKLGQGRWSDSGTIFKEGEDYNVVFADDRMSYVLTLTQEGLYKLDDIPSASYLYIQYDTVLTKDALIGTDTYGNQRTVVKDENTPNAETNDRGTTESQLANGDDVDRIVSTYDTYDSTYAQGATDERTATVQHEDATNQNTAQLTYATDRTQEHDYYSNTVKVFTYELDLTKTFTDGTQGNVSQHDTTGTHGNNREFDYSKVKLTMRGSVDPNSNDGQLAQSGKHAYGYGSIDVTDPDNSGKQQNGKGTLTTETIVADGENNVKEEETSVTWEQMLFIKTGDGTYRVWDPLTDNNVALDSSNQVASLDTNYSYGQGKTVDGAFDATTDTTESYTSDAAVGTVSKYLIPNSTTGLLTVKGLDARMYELTEVATAPGRNLMADKFYVEIQAPTVESPTNRYGTTENLDMENGVVQHAYVWTGDTKPTNIADYDVRNYDKTAARMDIGRVPLTIQNNEIIKVLKTGGNGIWIYAGVGTGVIALGAFIIFKRKKEDLKRNTSLFA